MKSRTCALSLLAGATLAAPPLAADVTVLTVENRTLTATSFSMGSDRKITLTKTDGSSLTLPAEDVVEISAPERTGRFSMGVDVLRAVFTNGDTLVGVVASADAKDVVALASPSLGAVTVPLEQLDAVLSARAQRYLPAARPDTRDRDVLVRVAGDHITGLLKSVAPEGITFEVDGKGLPILIRDLGGAYLTRVKEPPPLPDALLATVSARDGSTVTGVLEQVSADGIRIRSFYPTVAGTEPRRLVLPLAEFEFLYFRNGRCVYLSDLDPARVDEYLFYRPTEDPAPDDPLAQLACPYQKDRTVDPDHLGPLTLRRKIYRKGLGVHSYSSLTYALGGRFRRFMATIGVDDIGRGPEDIGRVVFQAWVDGKRVFDSGNVTADDAPRDVDVSVEGAQDIRLVVDFGENYEALDRADWASARLVR